MPWSAISYAANKAQVARPTPTRAGPSFIHLSSQTKFCCDPQNLRVEDGPRSSQLRSEARKAAMLLKLHAKAFGQNHLAR